MIRFIGFLWFTLQRPLQLFLWPQRFSFSICMSDMLYFLASGAFLYISFSPHPIGSLLCLAHSHPLPLTWVIPFPETHVGVICLFFVLQKQHIVPLLEYLQHWIITSYSFLCFPKVKIPSWQEPHLSYSLMYFYIYLVNRNIRRI